MATVNLQKGNRVELAKGVSKFRITLNWTPSSKATAYDLDIMALELNEDDVVNSERNLIFYGNTEDSTHALKHSGDDRTGEGSGEEMILEINKIDPSINKVLFLLNIFESQKNYQNFGEIHNIVLRLYEGDSTTPSLVYNLEEETSHNTATVLKICSIYKTNNIWKLRTINEGVTSTLSKVLKNYGLDSTDNTI